MQLYEHFLNNTGAPIHKSLHYFAIYDRHFKRYVGRPVTIIEIGAGGGGSAQMWRRYFGPLATIVGLDIRPECKLFEDTQIKMRIGDQADKVFLASIIEEFGPPDIVIDDGSHRMNDVLATFAYTYGRMARDGIYLVEDMHTAYWDEFGGGLGRTGTFIEVCKGLIDELNADYTRGALPPTEFTNATLSITFYDSVVVFERGITPTKQSVVTGDPTKPFG